MIKRRSPESTGYYSLTDVVAYRRMSYKEERELFIRYKRDGDIEARDEVLTNQLLFVAKEAIKIAPPWLRMNEVVSAANAALMCAAEKFDPTKGSRFASYVRKFIRGEVVRVCRDKAPVYYPNGKEVPGAVTWADQEVEPTDAITPTDHLQPSDACEQRDHLEFVQGAIRLSLNEPNITPIEQHVILQHFFEKKTYKRIAEEMPKSLVDKILTRQRIGQIKTKACKKLKTNLAKHGIWGVV